VIPPMAHVPHRSTLGSYPRSEEPGFPRVLHESRQPQQRRSPTVDPSAACPDPLVSGDHDCPEGQGNGMALDPVSPTRLPSASEGRWTAPVTREELLELWTASKTGIASCHECLTHWPSQVEQPLTAREIPDPPEEIRLLFVGVAPPPLSSERDDESGHFPERPPRSAPWRSARCPCRSRTPRKSGARWPPRSARSRA
jgi:hypothetical protein